ncbi:hypothetical protein BD289DRAFT_443472 [Coniella lustricola]|uniref:FAD-binding FR-type domain-containing protein n=1 Tax=Coniella lustricola TaxID=2025994 RepID=A0A2T2ZX01_9PEZI|nr:hypothetical protein BD289DRAFT_443472 [Coniella lustricola]
METAFADATIPDAAVTAIWARRLLSGALQLDPQSNNFENATASTSEYLHAAGMRNFPPEQREILGNLISGLLFGRGFVRYYNRVLLAVLCLFAVWRGVAWLRWRCECWSRRRVERCRGDGGRAVEYLRAKSSAEAGVSGQAGSSSSSSSSLRNSSSSSTSSATPRDTWPSAVAKDPQVDLERLPLLGSQRVHRDAPGPLKCARRSISKFLAYQPPPLHIVDKSLPSNATSLVIASWLALNLFFHLYRIQLGWVYFFCFATRSGDVFIVNLPLLYLLASKNQPLEQLTGASYESLNIFHRRVGEWMCLLAASHSLGLLAWQFILEPEWLRVPGLSAWGYFCHPIIYCGICAFVSYEVLYFTSLSGFRQRWYEIFLASHVVLQILALFFLYQHFRTARPYVLASLAIFAADRLVWRLGLRSTVLDAKVDVLPDGETVLLSAEWDVPSQPARNWLRRTLWWLRPRQSVLYGWKATDHVFLSVPALGATHMLQAHPFTIASPAPATAASLFCGKKKGSDVADGQSQQHEWHSQTTTTTTTTAIQMRKRSLRLLIRAHAGFTADLLAYAHHESAVRVRLDGPYGSTHALDMLRAADNAILIAGGSGIAVTLPLTWALVHAQRQHCGLHSNDDDDDYDVVESYLHTSDGLHHVRRRSAKRQRQRQRLRMLWVIHSEEHRHWVPQETLRQLVDAGLELVIPTPTVVGGRPDVADLLERWMSEHEACSNSGHEQSKEQTAVVVSGPDGLNRSVRNACAQALGRGMDVSLAFEKFGW